MRLHNVRMRVHHGVLCILFPALFASYFRSTFRSAFCSVFCSAFLHSGFHSCPCIRFVFKKNIITLKTYPPTFFEEPSHFSLAMIFEDYRTYTHASYGSNMFRTHSFTQENKERVRTCNLFSVAAEQGGLQVL